MQAAENAQVLQKCSASPSSAMSPFMILTVPFCQQTGTVPVSDDARVAGARGGRRHRRRVEMFVEAHRDDTQQQASTRRRGDPMLADFDEAVLRERCEPLQRLGEVLGKVDTVPVF